jgi:hypothetical protein
MLDKSDWDMMTSTSKGMADGSWRIIEAEFWTVTLDDRIGWACAMLTLPAYLIGIKTNQMNEEGEDGG